MSHRSTSAWLLALGIALGGCADTPGGATLRVAVRADVTGFYPNPPSRNESYTFDVNRSIYEGLVAFDPLLRLEPGLASRWDTPDDRTYVMELREGIRFSDGRPVTAHDVVASIDAAIRHGWSTKDYLQTIESVTVEDPRHVRIRTRTSNLILLTRLPWGFVLPAEHVDRDPVPVLGTGPYVLESWDPGRGFVFGRNPHYWGAPPAFARAEFRVVPEGRERAALVVRGEADVADQVPLEMLDELSRRPDLRLVARTGHRVLFLGLDQRVAPFDDPLVREALDLAIDRELLIERVLLGRGEVATQLVPPAIVGHNPAISPSRPDRERARELLREAGHAEGLHLVLDGPANRYVHDVQILHEVAEQLAEVGVEVEVGARDKLEYFDRLFSGRSPFHLLGWASETGDAGDALEFLGHSPQGGRLGRMNTTGLADPELDALIGGANASRDVAERSSLLQRAQWRLMTHRSVLPLVVQVEAVVHSAAVEWDPPLNLAVRPSDLRPVP